MYNALSTQHGKDDRESWSADKAFLLSSVLDQPGRLLKIQAMHDAPIGELHDHLSPLLFRSSPPPSPCKPAVEAVAALYCSSSCTSRPVVSDCSAIRGEKSPAIITPPGDQKLISSLKVRKSISIMSRQSGALNSTVGLRKRECLHSNQISDLHVSENMSLNYLIKLSTCVFGLSLSVQKSLSTVLLNQSAAVTADARSYRRTRMW